jgi:hypothetical protein
MQQRLEKAEADIAKKILETVGKTDANAGVEFEVVAVTSDLQGVMVLWEHETTQRANRD